MELPNPILIIGSLPWKPPKKVWGHLDESALRDRLIGFRLISDRFQTHLIDATRCLFRLHIERGGMMVSLPLALGIPGQATHIWDRMGSWKPFFTYTAHDNFRVKQATSSRAGTWIASFLQTLHRFSSGAFLSSGVHCQHNFLFFWSLGVAHMPMWVRAMLDLSQLIFSTGGKLRIDTLMPKWQKMAKAQTAAAGAWTWNGGLDRFFPLIRNDISSTAEL